MTMSLVEVVACIGLQHGSKVLREHHSFDTTTKGLFELLSWLLDNGCRHVAMETTGTYWKPEWHILEGDVELALAHAAHVRNGPGRKTDSNDATWIADLLAHGLITASMAPPRPTQELRGLTRRRRQLVRETGQHTQRVQRVLEDANIKLSSVIADTRGAGGRRILEAIIAGEEDLEKLAVLADQRVRCSRQRLREALHGFVTAHHRFYLRQHLDTNDHLQRTVDAFDAQIATLLEPFRSQYNLVRTIPGVGEMAAACILAEIGVEVSRFPSAAHLVSWAGLCPRIDESAGKRRSTRLRKGAPWLKPVLVQCAWGAARTKNTYTHTQFLPLRARRGPMIAIIAAAARILQAAYHILRDGVSYRELGGDCFIQRDRNRLAAHLIRRLKSLGFEVTLKDAA